MPHSGMIETQEKILAVKWKIKEIVSIYNDFTYLNILNQAVTYLSDVPND